MKKAEFTKRLAALLRRHQTLVARKNRVDTSWAGGWFERYRDPVVTADHVPVFWRYDLDPARNPHLAERLGVNAVFNPGAIELDGKVCLVCRVEGYDRKSFFAVAESASGVEGFRFRPRPIVMPETADPDTNVYDMRLTRHEDGWIYGLFCTERKDPSAPPGDESAAVAQCGIARTKDLDAWERLPDLASDSAQQRNVVLHPEFVGGKYAFYTRPQDSFIEAGKGGGIGWALADDMARAVIHDETIIDPKRYHTIKEAKNGMGPPPIKTPAGWLHVAHGVRNTAAGLRYVLYVLLCDLAHPERVLRRPGGYFLALGAAGGAASPAPSAGAFSFFLAGRLGALTTAGFTLGRPNTDDSPSRQRSSSLSRLMRSARDSTLRRLTRLLFCFRLLCRDMVILLR